MARLRDIKVIKACGVREFSRRVWREIGEDNLFTLAAALAYSWLFAIFPFFIFLRTLVDHLPKEAVETLKDVIEGSLPDQAAHIVWTNLSWVMAEADKHPSHGWVSLGLLISLWAASGGMNTSMSALDKCYDIPRGRPFYKMRLIAIGLTVLVSLMVLAVLLLLPFGTLFTRWMQQNTSAFIFKSSLWAWNAARYSLAILMMFTVLAIIYYFGTSIKQHFNPVSPGAAFSVAVWIGLGVVFRLYVQKYGRYDKVYGTVGGVAVLLLFFYIDALVLLVGAEINSEIDFALGIPRGSTDFRAPPPPPVSDETTDTE